MQAKIPHFSYSTNYPPIVKNKRKKLCSYRCPKFTHQDAYISINQKSRISSQPFLLRQKRFIKIGFNNPNLLINNFVDKLWNSA